MDPLVRSLKALADPIRLRIVEFLRNPAQTCCTQAGVVCACDLDEYLGLSQPTVSHHMKILVDAGLVEAVKQGRWVHYGLNRQAFASVVEALGQYETGGLVNEPTGPPAGVRLAAPESPDALGGKRQTQEDDRGFRR